MEGADNYYDEDQKNPQEQLIEFQKRFRNQESDRKAYAEETAANIKKQRTIIDKLKNENVALKDLIAKLNIQAAKGLSITQYGKNKEQIINECKLEIENQKQLQEEYQKNIDDFQKKIKEKKQTLGGINAGIENQHALNKQISILENRLDKANQKFNEAIAINKTLRQQIDSLRSERVIFDNLYKKLEKELREKRKEMANIIETANQAYEERDKANDQIQNLKQQAKRESADFEKELRDLSQLMEKSKKHEDYAKLTQKKQDNQQSSQLNQEKTKKTQSKFFKEKNLSQQQMEKIYKYEEDYAKIQAATRFEKIDDLINFFITKEEENFKTFKQVNEKSNEIEELEKQINEQKYEKDSIEGKGTNFNKYRQMNLEQLDKKLQWASQEIKKYDQQYQENYRTIRSINNQIESLFNTIECDKSTTRELAGQTGQNLFTESNMLIVLGIIEDRIIQIVNAYAEINQKNNAREDLENFFKQKDILEKNKDDGPNIGDDQDEDENDNEQNKPLTIQEFREKAQKILQQYNTKQGKQKGQGKQKKK